MAEKNVSNSTSILNLFTSEQTLNVLGTPNTIMFYFIFLKYSEPLKIILLISSQVSWVDEQASLVEVNYLTFRKQVNLACFSSGLYRIQSQFVSALNHLSTQDYYILFYRHKKKIIPFT